MNLSLSYSPVQELNFDLFKDKGVRVFIKRDDLIHPVIEGNKFRKLKYNLEKITSGQYQTIETFGGAYSNHLLAVSQAGKLINIATRGYINSKYADPENPTLKACRSNGMELVFLDKAGFKTQSETPASSEQYVFTLPEGGSNDLALKGSGEIVEEIITQLPETTHIISPLGTGGMIAGMVISMPGSIRLIAAPVLKMDALIHLQNNFSSIDFNDLEIWDEYHFGGYAKINPELIFFIQDWYTKTGIVIDPIYNGKALYGLFEKIEQGHFPDGSEIVYVHTGGSQGILGMNERFGLDLPIKIVN